MQGIDPAHAYEYLVRARQRILDWIRPVTQEQYTQEFPFGHRTIRTTLVHTAGAEWIYNRRLRREEAPPPADRPYSLLYDGDFPGLEAFWRGQTEETQRTLAEIADWTRPLEYSAVGGDGRRRRYRTTFAGVATQLVLHEVHHRAQVMAMLRQLGIAAQNVDYSALMYQVEILDE